MNRGDDGGVGNERREKTTGRGKRGEAKTNERETGRGVIERRKKKRRREGGERRERKSRGREKACRNGRRMQKKG